jgi:23S rRNA A2030 N6-methylase RlmJ
VRSCSSHPPYEESRSDFDAAVEAIATVLRRLPTAVIALWYPIKDERDIRAWLERIPARVPHDTAHPPTFCAVSFGYVRPTTGSA